MKGKGHYQRLVVKIGTNVLSKEGGLPDYERIGHIAEQLAMLHEKGVQIILVSSGSVAFGRSKVSVPEKMDTVSKRQTLASVGQIPLINTYAEYFSRHQLVAAQVLVTRSDFRDRNHYLNMRNCFMALWKNNIIPIVNENDAVSVTELMFTDNDELAGLVAAMMNVEALVILSNVDGLYDGDPDDPASRLIHEVGGKNYPVKDFVLSKKTEFGRGGMLTKSKMAKKTAELGIAVHIANGKNNRILEAILEGEKVGTTFLPSQDTPDRKKWLAHSENYSKGKIIVNEGAKKALQSEKATSLLPVGIDQIEGSFLKGDIVKIVDEEGQLLGLGMAEYNSEKAREFKGQKNKKHLIHYDYLYLHQIGIQ